MNDSEQQLAADIVECLARDFADDALPAALFSIAASSSSPRIQRCIAFAARGHPSYFDHLCKLARVDYRDVIMAAEYDRWGTQLYDFNRPIPQARLERDQRDQIGSTTS